MANQIFMRVTRSGTEEFGIASFPLPIGSFDEMNEELANTNRLHHTICRAN